MKRLICALLFLPQLVFAQYQAKCFSLDEAADIKQVSVRQTIDKDVEIPFGVRTPIYGLSVSGKIVFEDEDDSYVRVIMKDNYNYDHLVYENYPLLADGMSVDFHDIAMETKQLNGITPNSIRVELKNATLTLEALNYISTIGSSSRTYKSETVLQKEQSQCIVDRLNDNLTRHNKTWRAGMTSMAEKTFEEKKAMFGGRLPQLYGFEYYTGGIFVMPGALKSEGRANTRSLTTSYVPEWDWRNRHGKNWMTSVKDQGGCNSCWIFAAVGALEAYINLYYNQIASYINSNNEQVLGYNLSEQEIMNCIANNYCLSFGTPAEALYYIKNNGVVNEECFPYEARDFDCDDKCDNPAERVYIENYDTISDSASEDYIKTKLFRAPLPFSIRSWRHSMVLVGYKTLALGDVIRTGLYSTITIDSLHLDLIGKTAWLFKNSWGLNWGEENGYAYAIVNTDNRYYTNSLNGIVSCEQHTDSDIICEDADGDGYYCWGLGPKPSHCPSWVPDTPDGDDSDINYGPIDTYGNLQALASGTTINTPVFYSTNNTITQHLGVVNGGVITVEATTTMSGDGKIRVCEGGKLIVDGGTLQNADLELVPGCQVIIKNNGNIYMANGKTFNAPEGVIVDIPYGSVN